MYLVTNDTAGVAFADPKLGAACRKYLENEKIKIPESGNPVTMAWEHGDNFKVYRLSSAFKEIAESEPEKAKELALMFFNAIENYHSETK